MTQEQGSSLQLASSRVLVDGELQVGLVTIVDGIVARIETRQAPGAAPTADTGDDDDADMRLIDVGDAPICPAPVDLHLHGAGGVSVPPTGTVGALDDAIETLCARDEWAHPGMPNPYDYLATLPVRGGDPVDIAAQVAAVRPAPGSRCIGTRIEGLFLNPACAGAWPPASFREPDLALLDELVAACAAAGSPLRVLDIAPELPGAIALIERARELGVVTALAHSDATFEQAVRAIDAGATLATHTWNAMRPLHHREPGIVGAVLLDERVTCEVICDGVHVHPQVVRLTAAICGPGRVAAVSDASQYAGCPAGEYESFGGRIDSDETKLTRPDGSLVGAACLLTGAAPVLARAGLSLRDQLLAISVTPRRVIEPARGQGLELGDAAWVVGSAALLAAG